ncbi:MAG: glycerophosphodiester phosphodiesterase [Actinomycetota bacterium]|jgi:glycerophosphoryl diester phosphodiesterase
MNGNPWLERRSLCYAHQGGAWEAPSSTLYAIARAIELGVPAIELDVHMTADGELVVCHDETVNRTTNGQGEICDLNFGQLQELDNAYAWIPGADVTPDQAAEDYPLRGRAPSDHAFGIASLREVLELAPKTFLNFDIKRTLPEVEPYEAQLAAMLAEFGRVDDVIVASFSDLAIERFRSFAPEVHTGAGTQSTAEFYFAVQAGEQPRDLPYKALQVPESFEDITLVDERFVEAAHEAGVAVHVWTINDLAAMERLVDLGVDGIISDLPELCLGLLKRRGLAWRA